VRLRRLDDNLVTPLSQMLRGIEGTFRPFDFTPEAIRKAVKEEDEHWVMTSPAGDVIAYGMLRGWADGFRVPAVGIAVAPSHRRRGIATAMLMFLHYRAQERGCSHVMLHVDDENRGAQSLYRALGYRQEDDRWVLPL
jgi:ribosomal protein S18 acetylase RimI-like enzyme